MGTKVPEKILVNSFLKRLQEAKWSESIAEEGTKIIDTTDHNTKIVIDALRESAQDANYIQLMLLLTYCKTIKE